MISAPTLSIPLIEIGEDQRREEREEKVREEKTGTYVRLSNRTCALAQQS
jgi:hypothetical protein